ncbi:MAG: radical SAM protein [Elusimicrobiota bacterium]
MDLKSKILAFKRFSFRAYGESLRLIRAGELFYVIFLFAGIFAESCIKVLLLPKQKWSKRKIFREHLFLSCMRNYDYLRVSLRGSLRICTTYRCNASCENCYARGLAEGKSEDMSVEDFLRTVTWAKKNSFHTIRFLGGEPTIHPEIVKMLDICYKNKMFVSFATNNLFSEDVLDKMDSFWNTGVSINYNCRETLSEEKMRLFDSNIKKLKDRRIPFCFTYTFSDREEDWTKFFSDIKQYRPGFVRTSLVLPDFDSKETGFGLLEYKKLLYNKLYRLQDELIEAGIPFFNFRPVPSCLLSDEHWKEIESIFPMLLYTRCMIGYKGDFGLMLIVNPDMSTFACSSVFVQGKNMYDFKDREDVNDYFREALQLLYSTPAMKQCESCSDNANLVRSVNEEELINDSYKYFLDQVCQCGCLNFKWHTMNRIIKEKENVC